MKKLLVYCLIILSVGLISWGALVHKTVHQLAIYQLPAEMRSFFYTHADYLIKNATRPDVRRNSDSAEASKHFIDFEIYGKNAAYEMPFSWKAAKSKYNEDTLNKYGYVPYVIIDMQQKLTNAFKKGMKDSILFYAADLGHYIGDAHVPLHTTENYDGQLSNQKGIHSLWESMVPEIELEQFNLYTPHKAQYIANKEEAVWSVLRKSHALVKDVFEKEIEVTKAIGQDKKYRTQIRRGKEVKYYTSEFAKAYYQSLKNSINEQLLSSSQMISDFWYTAWVDAGKPNLEKLFNESLSAEQQNKIDAEMHSFKSNSLLKDKLLKAKEKASNDE